MLRELWFILIFVVFGTSAARSANVIDVIVSRSDKAIEIYFSMSGDVAIENFGLTLQMLTNDRGYANFSLFSQGTWGLGEAFWQDATSTINGQSIAFEAMSLMIHPIDQRLPFYTPLDGITAIEVCRVEPRDVPISASHLYVGLIAYPKDTMGEVRFNVPNLAGDLAFAVRDFTDHRPRANLYQRPDQLGFVVIPAAETPGSKMLKSLHWITLAAFLTLLAYSASRGHGPYAA